MKDDNSRDRYDLKKNSKPSFRLDESEKQQSSYDKKNNQFRWSYYNKVLLFLVFFISLSQGFYGLYIFPSFIVIQLCFNIITFLFSFVSGIGYPWLFHQSLKFICFLLIVMGIVLLVGLGTCAAIIIAMSTR